MEKYSSIFKKYLFWWVSILFLFIPLYPKFPFMNVPGTYVAIRAEDFLIAVIVLWWFISVMPNIREFLKSNIFRVIALFWFLGAVSVLSGIFLTQTVTPHLGVLHLLRRVEVMLLLFVAMTAITSIRQVKILLKIILFTTLIITLYGFGQQWLSLPVISTTNREFSKGLILTLTPEARVNSTFAGHYDLAAFLGLFLTVATSMMIYLSSVYKKLTVAIVSLFSFILLALTAARVSFVATLLGIGSVLWLSGQKKLILLLVAFVAFAFIISPELRNRTIATLTVNILNVSGPRYLPPPQNPNLNRAFSLENAATDSATYSGVARDIAPGEPLDSTELGVYRSFGIRLNEEWPRAIRAFIKNPFLGTGYSSITIATDNDYLRALGETGLLGTISLSLVFVYLLKRMWNFIRLGKKSFSFYFIVGLFSATLALLANAVFIDVLESSKVASIFWLSMGVGLAVINIEKTKS